MRFRLYLLIGFLFLTVNVQSQMMLYSSNSMQMVKNSVDSGSLILGGKINAAGLVLGTNLAVWGFDRYVTHSPFAYISPSTVRDNFRKGFVWDNDFFSTNLFLHPYHGGLYFNAARVNGMSYWESFPYSVGGSLLWELFMEREYPSINDLIATSIGGSGLGEVTFRLSDRIIDDRTSGMERVGREVATFLVSPVRGVNRFLNGRSWKHQRTKGNVLPSIPVHGFAKMGYRNLFDDGKNQDDKSSMAFVKTGFSYGNPYDEENDQPYDYFSAQASLNLFSSQPLISRVKVIGMLYSDHFALNNPKEVLTWGIYQHFNYLESTSDYKHTTLYPYKLSEAASVGPGLLFKKTWNKDFIFYASTYLSGILLGSSQSDHYHVYNRDYNLGSGYSAKLDLEWFIKEKLTVQLKSDNYRIFTWLGADPSSLQQHAGSTQGDRSCASLNVAALHLDYVLDKHLFVGLESSYFFRSTDYANYSTVKHGVFDNNLSLGWLF